MTSLRFNFVLRNLGPGIYVAFTLICTSTWTLLQTIHTPMATARRCRLHPGAICSPDTRHGAPCHQYNWKENVCSPDQAAFFYCFVVQFWLSRALERLAVGRGQDKYPDWSTQLHTKQTALTFLSVGSDLTSQQAKLCILHASESVGCLWPLCWFTTFTSVVHLG